MTCWEKKQTDVLFSVLLPWETEKTFLQSFDNLTDVTVLKKDRISRIWEIITHQKTEQDKIQPDNFADLKLADHEYLSI